MTKPRDDGRAELADRTGLTRRRVDQLVDLGVFIAGGDERFDVDFNVRRYRAYKQNDREYVVRELEDACDKLTVGMKSLKAEPNMKKRRTLAGREKIGAQIGRIDNAYRLGNAMATEGERGILNIFTGRTVGDAISAYFELLGMTYVGDGEIAPVKRRA